MYLHCLTTGSKHDKQKLSGVLSGGFGLHDIHGNFKTKNRGKLWGFNKERWVNCGYLLKEEQGKLWEYRTVPCRLKSTKFVPHHVCGIKYFMDLSKNAVSLICNFIEMLFLIYQQKLCFPEHMFSWICSAFKTNMMFNEKVWKQFILILQL